MRRKRENIKSLFEAALKQPPEALPSFLAQSCPDPATRAEVERLLACHNQLGHFLTTSPRGDPTQKTENRAPLKAAGEILAERFRVVRFLARGGMGEVYEAEDLELQERVALKMIRPEIATWYPNCLPRFKREVLLAKRVTHPNVCRIFDFFRHSEPPVAGAGRNRGLTFVSMELLQGETLSERLRRVGRTNTQEALLIVTQVAAALDAAHAKGKIYGIGFSADDGILTLIDDTAVEGNAIHFVGMPVVSDLHNQNFHLERFRRAPYDMRQLIHVIGVQS